MPPPSQPQPDDAARTPPVVARPVVGTSAGGEAAPGKDGSEGCAPTSCDAVAACAPAVPMTTSPELFDSAGKAVMTCGGWSCPAAATAASAVSTELGSGGGTPGCAG